MSHFLHAQHFIHGFLIRFSRPRDTRDASSVLRKAFETVRELELYLKFFNLVYADVLWAIKVNFLCLTILCGFSSIRLIHTNPFLGCLYIYLFLFSIVNYIGMFQFAFKVTEKVEQLKESMEIKSAGLVNLADKKYWKRALRSIPRMGINVGGFSRVEREAVPIFIDFSVKQIVSALLASH